MRVVEHPQTDEATLDSGRLISLAAAREWLGGISRGSLYALIERGELASVRVGRRRMIDTRDLEAFVERHREVHGQPDPPESATPAGAGEEASRGRNDGDGSSQS